MNFTIVCKTHKKPILECKGPYGIGKEGYCKLCSRKIDLNDNKEIEIINGLMFV